MAPTSLEEAKAEVESAREEVLACENEIQNIKSSLRQLPPESTPGGEEENPNSLEVSVLKVEGLPEAAQPTFALQLSSPVEELTLSKLYDPSSEDSVAVFMGVEASVATLTVTVKDAELELGGSEPHDVAPLCPLDAMTPQPQYVSEISVAILASGETKPAVVKEEPEKVEGIEEAASDEEAPFEDAKSEEELAVVSEETTMESDKNKKDEAVAVPLCVVTLRVSYKPSAKDQREELCDLLNKASQKKNRAIEQLRNKANAVSRATASAPSTAVTTRSDPAVKPGFLNKSSTKKKQSNRLVDWYNRNLGPESLSRQIFFTAKNYIIFFGAVALFHFKGQELALPPPV